MQCSGNVDFFLSKNVDFWDRPVILPRPIEGVIVVEDHEHEPEHEPDYEPEHFATMPDLKPMDIDNAGDLEQGANESKNPDSTHYDDKDRF